jgi:HEAT repeat protein
MNIRALGSLFALVTLITSAAWGQASSTGKEPVTDGRTLSQWVADLKAAAPQVRNAAAYEISGLGASAAPAVPALIAALDDSEASVRFPVTVALGEIGPAASAAVPRLKKMMDEEINDEVAAAARRALRKIQPDAVPSEKTD